MHSAFKSTNCNISTYHPVNLSTNQLNNQLPLLTFRPKNVSCSANSNFMNQLMLSAFYDKVTTSVGPTLMWVFFLLMIIELIYVMFKYTDGSIDEKK
jgi:hypothetical protein